MPDFGDLGKSDSLINAYPTTSNADPTTSTVDPTTSTVDPATSAADPATSTVDPPTSTVDPPTSTVDPTSSTVDPTTSAVDPTTSTVDPTTSTADSISSLVTVDPTSLPNSDLIYNLSPYIVCWGLLDLAVVGYSFLEIIVLSIIYLLLSLCEWPNLLISSIIYNRFYVLDIF